MAQIEIRFYFVIKIHPCFASLFFGRNFKNSNQGTLKMFLIENFIVGPAEQG